MTLFVGLFVVCLTGSVYAQVQIQVDAVTAGGNIATSTNYTVRSSVGQVAVSSASSTNHSISSGIWPTIYLKGETTAISPDEPVRQIPDQYSLEPAYPNPFNPSTQIDYALPEAADVKLTVYNMLGRRIKVLVNKQQQAGRHSVTFHSNQLSSGTYIYRIQAGDFIKVRKMTLLK